MGKNIRGGRAEVEATLKDRIGAGLQRLKAKLRGFAVGSARIGGSAIAAATAGIAPIAAAVGTFLSVGDNLDKMSMRTGESVENLSTMGFAATETGASLDQLERGIFGMQRSLRGAERGMKTSLDALGSLGLTLNDLDGLSPAEQMKLLGDRLAGIEDAGRRGAIAQEIFGRAGRQLMPMLSMGAKGIEEMQKKARDLGIEMSGEDATAAAVLTDRLHELWEVVKATGVQVGAALAPALIKVVTFLAEAAKHAIDFIRNNRRLVTIVVGGLAGLFAFGAALLGMSMLAMGAAAAIGLVTGAVSVLGSVLGAIFSPIGIVIGLLVAGAAAFLYYSGTGSAAISWISERLGQLLTWSKQVFGGIYDAIAAGNWALAGRIMWLSLQVAFKTGMGWIMGKWLGFKTGFVNIFDLLVTALRVGWQIWIDSIAKSLLWVIDQINGVSEAIAGFKVIALDTEGIKAAIDEDSKRFTKRMVGNLADRQQERETAKNEALKQYDTSELNAELEQLIGEAKAQRELADLLRAQESERPEIPEQPDLEAIAVGTGSSFGSFSAAVLSRFQSADESLVKRTTKASEETADNTAELVDLVRRGGLLVT